MIAVALAIMWAALLVPLWLHRIRQLDWEQHVATALELAGTPPHVVAG